MIPAREPEREAPQGFPAFCPTPGRFINAETGEVVTAPCKRRRCSYCGPTLYRPDKLARIHRGMGRPGARYFMLTATAPSFCRETCYGASHSVECRALCEDWNETAAACWHRFTVAVRRLLPTASAEFFKTWELQQRGALHAHAIFRMRGVVLPEETLRRLLVRAGFGSVMDVRRADAGAARYLAKYLTKDLGRSPGRVWSWSGQWVEHATWLEGQYLWCDWIWYGPKPKGESTGEWVWAGVQRGPPAPDPTPHTLIANAGRR